MSKPSSSNELPFWLHSCLEWDYCPGLLAHGYGVGLPAATDNPAMTSRNQHFSGALVSLVATVAGDETTLSAITCLLGNRSTGSLLLFLALPMVLPIPAPGISVLFGVPLIVISAQLLFGRASPWLPVGLGNRPIRKATLESYVARALPTVERLERFVRPRFRRLTQGIIPRLAGAMSLLLALIITLPVPLGHLVPGAAISVMALGLIEQDGLAMLAGFLVGGIALVVVVAAMLGLVAAGRSFL